MQRLMGRFKGVTCSYWLWKRHKNERSLCTQSMRWVQRLGTKQFSQWIHSNDCPLSLRLLLSDHFYNDIPYSEGKWFLGVWLSPFYSSSSSMFLLSHRSAPVTRAQTLSVWLYFVFVSRQFSLRISLPVFSQSDAFCLLYESLPCRLASALQPQPFLSPQMSPSFRDFNFLSSSIVLAGWWRFRVWLSGT